MVCGAGWVWVRVFVEGVWVGHGRVGGVGGVCVDKLKYGVRVLSG